MKEKSFPKERKQQESTTSISLGPDAPQPLSSSSSFLFSSNQTNSSQESSSLLSSYSPAQRIRHHSSRSRGGRSTSTIYSEKKPLVQTHFSVSPTSSSQEIEKDLERTPRSPGGGTAKRKISSPSDEVKPKKLKGSGKFKVHSIFFLVSKILISFLISV